MTCCITCQDATEKPLNYYNPSESIIDDTLIYTSNNSVYVKKYVLDDQSRGDIPEKSPSTDQRTHSSMKKYIKNIWIWIYKEYTKNLNLKLLENKHNNLGEKNLNYWKVNTKNTWKRNDTKNRQTWFDENCSKAKTFGCAWPSMKAEVRRWHFHPPPPLHAQVAL